MSWPEICSILVVVASFSFQIAGAVLLLLWSIGKCDQKVKDMCVQNSGVLWENFDRTTTLSKDNLQSNAKLLYKNICAFLDIIIGYICGVFVADIPVSRWIVFCFVVIMTAVILGAGILLCNIVAKKNYPENQVVKMDDIAIKPGTSIYKEIK